jgi:hypothetical protein
MVIYFMRLQTSPFYTRACNNLPACLRVQTTSSNANQNALWELLPTEIRLIILKMLAQDPGSSSEIDTRETRMACYATVSNEWQAVFERKNFYRLTLNPSCLGDFDKIVRRQRGLIKDIWLRIKLRTYGCPSCTELETNTRIASNNAIIRKAICKLFTILSAWKRNGDWSNKGLALELSTYSPSDSRHAFKDHYFETDAYSESINEYKPSNLHDPSHGWVDGQQIVVPGSLSILRLFGRSELSAETSKSRCCHRLPRTPTDSPSIYIESFASNSH